jgi:hypothetical protein
VDLESQTVKVPHEWGGAAAEQSAGGAVPLRGLARQRPENSLSNDAAGVEGKGVAGRLEVLRGEGFDVELGNSSHCFCERGGSEVVGSWVGVVAGGVAVAAWVFAVYDVADFELGLVLPVFYGKVAVDW